MYHFAFLLLVMHLLCGFPSSFVSAVSIDWLEDIENSHIEGTGEKVSPKNCVVK